MPKRQRETGFAGNSHTGEEPQYFEADGLRPDDLPVPYDQQPSPEMKRAPWKVQNPNAKSLRERAGRFGLIATLLLLAPAGVTIDYLVNVANQHTSNADNPGWCPSGHRIDNVAPGTIHVLQESTTTGLHSQWVNGQRANDYYKQDQYVVEITGTDEGNAGKPITCKVLALIDRPYDSAQPTNGVAELFQEGSCGDLRESISLTIDTGDVLHQIGGVGDTCKP